MDLDAEPRPKRTLESISPRTFRRWVATCRKLFPTDHPVKVRRGPEPRGWCAWVRTWTTPRGKVLEHHVHISDALCRQATLDALLHEWSHILHGERHGAAEHGHPAEFWAIFGELYRTWHREK